MKENNGGSLPRFDSIDELIDFFETHDMGEFMEDMTEVDFEVDLKKRKYLFSLDAEVARKLSEIARAKKMSSEALANVWLNEKISEERMSNGW